MAKEAVWEKGIYRLANAGLLAGVTLFGGAHVLGIGDLTAWLVAEAAVILGLLAGINFFPLRGKFICLSAAALGVGAAVSAAGAQESLLFLRSYFPWLMGSGEGYGPWAMGYAFLQTAILVILCYLLQILTEKAARVKFFLVLFLGAGTLFCLLKHREVPPWGMAFGICYVVTVCAEWTEGRWKKRRSGSRRVYMLRIMPFLAAYLLLLGCMPAPETPYEWKWVKNLYRQAREAFLEYAQRIKWEGREGFGMAFSGFSPEAELGGDLQENAREVMTVQFPGPGSVNLYLTGMVYDTFDQMQWRRTYDGDPEGVFLDTAETLCAVRAYGGEYQKDYLHSVKLRIRYQDFSTGYVFAPLKTRKISCEDRDFSYTCEGGSLSLEGHRGYGTAYELEFYQLNGGQEQFDRFLEACMEEAPCDDGFLGEQTRRYDAARAASHRREMVQNYLGEVRLSREAADYLARITRGAETEVEKLRAIERELSSYVYTRTPGEIPDRIRDEEDFLDYFLLETRQGYCTYFATAFVLLARAEGIPARYVQGFCVPSGGMEEVSVYSGMAHAWPEVYIPGAGWIPFEPTPGYGETRYTPWELSRPAPEGDMQGDGEGHGEALTEEALLREAGEEIRTEEPEAEEEKRTGHLWRVFGYMVPAALAGYALLLLLDNIGRGSRYRRMCPREKLWLEVSRNLKILSLLGIKRREWETLQELGERCGFPPGEERSAECGAEPGADVAPEGDAAQKIRFLDNYESVVYGGRSVSEEMIRDAADERKVFLEALKRERRWAYVRWQVRMFMMRYR